MPPIKIAGLDLARNFYRYHGARVGFLGQPDQEGIGLAATWKHGGRPWQRKREGGVNESLCCFNMH